MTRKILASLAAALLTLTITAAPAAHAIDTSWGVQERGDTSWG